MVKVDLGGCVNTMERLGSMVGLDIMGMMDMGCISRNLMSLKYFAVHG